MEPDLSAPTVDDATQPLHGFTLAVRDEPPRRREGRCEVPAHLVGDPRSQGGELDGRPGSAAGRGVIVERQDDVERNFA